MQSVLSSATTHQVSNENVTQTPARNVSSTTKHPRRALGDISNRKVVQQQVTSQNYDSSIQKTPKKGLAVSTSTVPTATKPEVLRNNNTTNHQLLSNSYQSLSLRTATKRNNNNNKVSFILPDNVDKEDVAVAPPPSEQKNTLSSSETKVVHSKASSLFFPLNGIWNDHDDENEIEVSAGRLYKDQLFHDDDTFDDELSIEGAKTVRQDYIDLFMELHNDKIQQKEMYIQQCIQSLDNIAINYDFDNGT
jgi:hypothetical protein